MKKYIFKTILCLTLAMTLTTSCELDQYPEGLLPTDKSWETMDDATHFYTGLISNLRSTSTSNYGIVSEAQADLFNMRKEGSYASDMHEWTFSSSFGGGDGCWNSNYGLIATANDILNHIEAIPVKNMVDSVNYYEIKGASLFARALAYNNMTSRYCANYNAATAKDELGLPLVTELNIHAKPARSNLFDTFAFIEKDIQEALDMFTKSNKLIRKIANEGLNMENMIMPSLDHPSLASTLALNARFSLDMGKYEEAEQSAKALMAAYPLCTATEYKKLWLNDMGNEIIFMPLMTKAKGQRGGFGDVFLKIYEGRTGVQPSYIPTQGLIDLYENTDIRKNVFFTKKAIGVAEDTENGTLFNKYPGNPDLLLRGEDPAQNLYNMVKVFRTSEMYLIAAEAALFKAEKDETAALNYLNELRKNRNASDLTSSGDNLIKDMKEEWIREMAGEGFRLNCLKRWNDDIVRKTPQHFQKEMLANTPIENYTKLSVKVGSSRYYKIIWEIPENDLRANQNLVPNWK